MAYLVQNTRTKDFIDNQGDWTLIRSLAKRFSSKPEAQKFIDDNMVKGDEPYMKIIQESSKISFKKFLKEATMSDIPHEIDDQIHKLKDMRFDLEETEKNWKLAGLDTKPLLDVINSINGLIENMYNNGAKLADQEVVKEDVTLNSKEAVKYVEDFGKDLKSTIDEIVTKFKKRMSRPSSRDSMYGHSDKDVLNQIRDYMTQALRQLNSIIMKGLV